MTVQIRHTDAGIELENSRLRIAVHRATLRCQVSSTDGCALRGFRPRLLVHDRPVFAQDAVADEVEEIDTALGQVTRLVLIARSAARIDLLLQIELGDDSPGAVFDLGAENRGEASVRVNAMDPIHWKRAEEGEVALPGPAEAVRFFRMGYQSWSPSGYPLLSARDPRPRLKLLHTVHYGPFTGPIGRGRHVSDFVTTVRAPGHAGLTLGFLTHRRFLNHVELGHRGSRLDELTARASTEGLRLGPGETVHGERLWLGLDAPDADPIGEWAARSGAEMDAPIPAPVGSAWCSWYQYFTKVTAEDVRANTKTLAELDAGIETIQIDDGFQAAVGDWLEWDDAFPDGVAPLAQEIRGAGFRAGLWLAPFLVSRASKLADQHPEWILKGASGRPRVANVNGAWKGRICHALDPTHPGVQEWLGHLASTVRGFGFDYLKLDFLYAGALGGQRHDESAPSAEAYRRGIGAIRAGAGDDAFLLGCGAPLGPSIGLFESMRIGPDVAPAWRARGLDLAFGIRSAPSAENSLRNILARAPLHQRLWVNDPDCVLLRDEDTGLRDHEVKTLAGAIAASGGLIVASDDLARVGPERRALLRRLLPALGGAPELGAVSREIPDRLLLRLADGSALLFWVNLQSSPRSLELAPAELGLSGPVYAYDVFANALLPGDGESIRVDAVRPRASVLLRLTPRDGKTRVLGSTLHIAGGGLETAAVRERGDGEAEISLRLPGRHQGTLLVAPAGGEPVAVGVGFTDRLDLRVGNLGEGG